ncbi:hypothetical protein NIES4075_14340 [Tolypothrix sp. NIES-4075]|nr:hypothetical protein NIES4075_14340 [Tolypothrix sp. NIES-4075]
MKPGVYGQQLELFKLFQPVNAIRSNLVIISLLRDDSVMFA